MPYPSNGQQAEPLDSSVELSRLRKEVRGLRRQLDSLQSIVDRDKQSAALKANLSSIIAAEKSKQEKYLNLLLENCPDIILLFDRHGRFSYCTDAFLRKAHIRNFGLINGRHYREVFAGFSQEPGWLESLEQQFLAATRENRTLELDVVADIGGDGAPRNYTIHYTPMLGETGEADGAMALFHDLTDILKAKQQAEQASSAKTNFLATMSHEMRTPMNAIIGMTNIARTAGDLAKKDYCLEKISEASAHLLGVINDILDMSKIEANKFELVFGEFHFEKMLMKVTNVLTFRADEKNQNMLVKIEDRLPACIISDEQRLSQVITNLLSNAIKFTPENGTITLSAGITHEQEDRFLLQVQVQDTGIGISEEQQEKLFQSFEQADGGIARKYGGTGLGLAISKRIVEMLGGAIGVDSQPGKGSCFYFSVPVRRGASVPQSLLPSGIGWKGLRVLAVDDSWEVREYFREIAQPLDFHCDVASSGPLACELLLKQEAAPYDIVFIDWRMPDMDGMELTRHIKQISPNSIVVMISAAEWSEIEAVAKQAGVDRFLPKPLFSSTIVDCVNECMGSATASGSLPGGELDYAGTLQDYRLLLAEDIAINREIVLALLEPAGIQLDCAENGLSAVEKFKGDPDRYDLILMDIHMPDMDGYEATRAIRELPSARARTIPIIAMTANVFQDDIERCMEAGMNDHIGKPLEIAEVMETLRRHLPRKNRGIAVK